MSSSSSPSVSSSLRVCVLAASGGLGRHVLRQSLSAGHNVFAVVRNSKKLISLLSDDEKTKLEGKIIEMEFGGEGTEGEKNSQQEQKAQNTMSEIFKKHQIHTVLVPSHYIGTIAIRASDDSQVVQSVIMSGGAPCLHSSNTYGVLAWRDLLKSSGKSSYKDMALLHWNNFSAMQFTQLKRFVLICPGYMMDLPEREEKDVEYQNDLFINHCNDQPLPYANCAKSMTDAVIVDGKVEKYMFHRVAISVKKGVPKQQ